MIMLNDGDEDEDDDNDDDEDDNDDGNTADDELSNDEVGGDGGVGSRKAVRYVNAGRVRRLSHHTCQDLR